jgi:hypothetical protein
MIKKLLGDHDREEFIRTLDSIASIVLQLVTLGVQVFGLWWIIKHSH